MQFAQPIWLLMGAIACGLLLWQYCRFDLRQRTSLAQFAASRLTQKLTSSVSIARRRGKRALYVLGIALVFVALARPQAGFTWQETHRKGLELLFAVDTSKSMLSRDVKPDRLTRAKLAISDLLGKLNGDGVGLVAFAGDAFLQCPVTLDYNAFRESLDALDVNVIPRGGTDIAAAIQEAQAVFKTRSAQEKILVLVTDGEDLGGEALTAAQAAAKDGVKIFTVGVGTAAGDLVPIRGEMGATDFARDDQGKPVKSHLDEAMLEKIAEATGGMYRPLGARGEGLDAIYTEGLAPFTRHDLTSRQAKVPIERFMWPLAAAIACFIGEMLIGTRRKLRAARPLPARPQVKIARRLRPAAAGLALFALALPAHASESQQAEADFKKGDFAHAHQEYAAGAVKDPANATLRYNSGTAAYRMGDFAEAQSAFESSLKTEQVPLQQQAYYNLGNTQYRLGQKGEKSKPEETIKTWESAVKSYDAALQITPSDAEARHNRDFVQSRIDQLKKEQEQKKQDQQKQEQKQQLQKQDQKDQKNQSGQGQNGEPSDSKQGSGQPKDSPANGKDQKQNDQKNGADQSKQNRAQPGQKDGSQTPQKPGEKHDQSAKADAKPDSGEAGKEDQQAQAQSRDGSKGDQRSAATQPLNAEKKPGQGDIQPAAAEKAKEEAATAQAEEHRVPGEMTREEAKGLLDAMKGEERKVPAISQRGRAGLAPAEQKHLNDW